MEKLTFINILKDFYNNIKELYSDIEKSKNKQIQAKNLLAKIETLSEDWFNNIKNSLEQMDIFNKEILEEYSNNFSTLLECADKNPVKKSVLDILNSTKNSFNKNIIIKYQRDGKVDERNKLFQELLNKLNGLELDYMKESIECAETNKNRASIILGWCAAVYRIHETIEKLGFEKFNNASKTLINIKSGRYKRFEKSFDVQNISDLRMTVFDNDLLWVIEYLSLIDGNEHEKLSICFTMRNTSAHPGDSIITPENISSFYSDLKNIIFDNPKFSIS
jgi:hypothetical protein